MASPCVCIRSLRKSEIATETAVYYRFLFALLALSLVGTALQPFWAGAAPLDARDRPDRRRWACCCSLFGRSSLPGCAGCRCPIFPSPAGVLLSMVNDRALIFDSTWHSLLLLLGGYAARRAAAG